MGIQDIIYQALVQHNRHKGMVSNLFNGVQLMLYHLMRLVDLLEGVLGGG